jgi:CII-binding regulator of phage lambda lysogenization HflD
MFEAIKPLLDSGILNEETRQDIETALRSKLDEARESMRAEIREEMASRYEHDKAVMVEALDRMVNDTLKSHIRAISEERTEIQKDRVAYINHYKSKAKVFENFMTDALAKEMREFRAERANYKNAIGKLEGFIAENLRNEISEFAEDKADLARAKVAVVTEGKEQLAKVRERFVKQSADLVEGAVKSTLRNELTQLKSDIREAKENNFGRKIFEAFVTEFSATHLNERAEVKKLINALATMEHKLMEAREEAQTAKTRVEVKENQLRAINESVARKAKLEELLKPLSKEKADVMKSLLESVSTDRLDVAFKKYLKPVMDGGIAPARKQAIVESHKEVTGDRASVPSPEATNNIVEIRRLAGLVNN